MADVCVICGDDYYRDGMCKDHLGEVEMTRRASSSRATLASIEVTKISPRPVGKRFARILARYTRAVRRVAMSGTTADLVARLGYAEYSGLLPYLEDFGKAKRWQDRWSAILTKEAT